MPLLLNTPEYPIADQPDRMIILIPGLRGSRAHNIANTALREARRKAPKVTGRMASRIVPLYGSGFFGLHWQDSYAWFQDHGIKPFTMHGLAGKTIPMWVDDPTGEERRKNPKAQVRTTQSGKTQVLIFRKAAQHGARVQRWRTDPLTGQKVLQDRPAAYPGAAGRIGTREAGQPLTTTGRVAGQIARGNIGVRWRHPGLEARGWINNSITLACQWNGILPIRIYVADSRWRVALKAVLREEEA